MLLLAVAMTGWLGVPDGNAQPTLYIAASEELLEPSCQNCFFPGPSSLHRVNPQTGRATPVGDIGFDAVGGMAFHPLTGVLYAVGQRRGTASFFIPGIHVLITIDPATGVGTEIGAFTGPMTCPACGVEDLAFRPNGVLYGMVSGTLVTVDLETGASTFIAFPCCFDPSVLTNIDSLTFSADGSLLFSRVFESNFMTFDPATGEIFGGLRGISIEATTMGSTTFEGFDLSRLDALDTEPGTGRLWGVTQIRGTSCSSACLVTIDPLLNPLVGTRVGFILDAFGSSGQLGFVLALAWSPGTDNTPAGANVVVQVAPATLTFERVTQAGTTTVTTSATGPPLPSGFSLGTPRPIRVSTTAVSVGFVDVCIDYTGIAFDNENSPGSCISTGRLRRRDDVAQHRDHVICGRSATLSPFVVVEPAQSVAQMIVDLIESVARLTLAPSQEQRLVAASRRRCFSLGTHDWSARVSRASSGSCRSAPPWVACRRRGRLELIEDARAIRTALNC